MTALSGNSSSDRLVSIERLLFDDQQVGLQPIPDASAPAYNSQPGFLFDEVFYLLSNPELVPTVAAADALAHYLNVGSAQGLQPNSWFDANYYEARWDDLDRLNLTDAQLFQHYNLYGVWEGRSAGPDFDGFNCDRSLAAPQLNGSSISTIAWSRGGRSAAERGPVALKTAVKVCF